MSIEAYARIGDLVGEPSRSHTGFPSNVGQAAVHLPPEIANLARILSDQQLAQTERDRMRAIRIHDCLDGLWSGIHLADAGDAVVRLDDDEEIVLAPIRDRRVERRRANHDGFDVGDQQDASSRLGRGDC